MLLADLQNQFPNDLIEIISDEDEALVRTVADSIEYRTSHTFEAGVVMA